MAEPLTREEKYLNAIANSQNINLKPITREEIFLAKASGQDITTPTPITRREMFLSKISSGGTASGENKLAQYINGTLTKITAEDLEGMRKLRERAFAYVPLTSIELPSTLNSIEGHAFQYISGSKSTREIKYDGTVGDWATKISVSSYTAIPTQVANTMSFRDSQGEYYKLEDDLIFPDGVQRINAYMFEKFENILNITIPSSCLTIGNGAFEGCSNVVNLNLNEGLQSIGDYAFAANALRNIVIPNSCQSMTSSFYGCSALTTARIGNGITSINSKCFYNCSKLTDIYIDKPEGSISGSPWGASSATVHWNTPLPSEEV